MSYKYPIILLLDDLNFIICMHKTAVKFTLLSFVLITECKMKKLEKFHSLISVSTQEKIKASTSSQCIKILNS